MKQFLLISNTTEKNIDNNILNYLSKTFAEISFKKTNFRELSPHGAYELELKNEELNIELKKKVNRKLKLSSTYINIYNNDKVLKAQKILENSSHEEISANIFIAEGEYRIKPKYTLKSELQHLHTNQHFGNWGMILIEANMDRFFFSIQDLYNYGHPEDAAHYYSLTLGMVKNSHRLELRYGKVRAGLFCVGGICREVPASNGFSINLTSTF